MEKGKGKGGEKEEDKKRKWGKGREGKVEVRWKREREREERKKKDGKKKGGREVRKVGKRRRLRKEGGNETFKNLLIQPLLFVLDCRCCKCVEKSP